MLGELSMRATLIKEPYRSSNAAAKRCARAGMLQSLPTWPKNTRERKPESADQRTHCARDLEAHTRQQERQCATMPSRRLPQLLQSISIRVSRTNTHKSLEYPLISALERSPSTKRNASSEL